MKRLAAFRSFGGIVLAVLALSVRIAIPSGFMIAPGAGESRLPAVVICSGHGVETTPADPAGKDRSGPDGRNSGKATDHHPCVFAHAAPLAGGGSAIPWSEGYGRPLPGRAAIPRDQRPGLGLPAPPPPTTGPPSII